MADNQNTFSYRPDIDGLRGLAIALVIGFHFFPTLFTGGFVGVDVFFVISGFLISTIIMRGMESGNFSFVEFYYRRAKRLFPALTVVLLACFVFGWFSLLNTEYQQLGKHLKGGVAFISNFIYWNESGYFDNAADTKPLLHLWSLSVEEQFYILWPFLLWIGYRFRWNLIKLFLGLALVSFALNIWFSHRNPIADFYSPQTRFWELILGSTIAFLKLRHPKYLKIIDDRRSIQNSLSFFGIILVLSSAFLFGKDHSFPGFLALLPTVGTTLIICVGPTAWLNRLLSKRTVISLGLISYPLYLWHWPLLSFGRIILNDPSTSLKIVLIVVSLFLAWLTYRFVEIPLRFGRYKNIRFATLVAPMILLGLAGHLTQITGGIEGRYKMSVNDPSIRNGFPTEGKGQVVSCKNLLNSITDSYCFMTQNPHVAILGDSHAGRLLSGFSVSSYKDFQRAIALFATDCTLAYSSKMPERCKSFIERAVTIIRETPSIEYVVLSNFSHSLGKEIDEDLEGFERTVQQLRDAKKKVIFVVDNPSLNKDPTTCIRYPLKIRDSFKQRPLFCDGAYSTDLDINDGYAQLVPRLRHRLPDVIFHDTHGVLCENSKCRVFDGEKLLYDDGNHLSAYGSEFVINDLVKKLSANSIEAAGADSKVTGWGEKSNGFPKIGR